MVVFGCCLVCLGGLGWGFGHEVKIGVWQFVGLWMVFWFGGGCMGKVGDADIFPLVRKRADELGVKTILVASTSGVTGLKAVEAFRGYDVVVVTHSHGFKEKDKAELLPEYRNKIIAGGGKILTATHAFGGVGRAVRSKFNTYQIDELIANTLRIFGQGTKVAVEIALMAADSGLISVQKDVVSIGGTGEGADTALVLQAANVNNFFDVKVREVITKPRL